MNFELEISFLDTPLIVNAKNKQDEEKFASAQNIVNELYRSFSQSYPEMSDRAIVALVAVRCASLVVDKGMDEKKWLKELDDVDKLLETALSNVG